MQPGHDEQRTHDYVRHGTTTLFAALEIAAGRVTGLCKNRHRHQEFPGLPQACGPAYSDRELHHPHHELEQDRRSVKSLGDLEERVSSTDGVPCVRRPGPQLIGVADGEPVPVSDSVPQVANHFRYRGTVEVAPCRQTVAQRDQRTCCSSTCSSQASSIAVAWA